MHPFARVCVYRTLCQERLGKATFLRWAEQHPQEDLTLDDRCDTHTHTQTHTRAHTHTYTVVTRLGERERERERGGGTSRQGKTCLHVPVKYRCLAVLWLHAGG